MKDLVELKHLDINQIQAEFLKQINVYIKDLRFFKYVDMYLSTSPLGRIKGTLVRNNKFKMYDFRLDYLYNGEFKTFTKRKDLSDIRYYESELKKLKNNNEAESEILIKIYKLKELKKMRYRILHKYKKRHFKAI